MTALHPRINIDPDIMSGQPVIAGTRVPVSLLIGLLGSGMTEAEILDNYPFIKPGDLQAALAFGAEILGRLEFPPCVAA